MPKRARTSFIPDLSSDTDDDTSALLVPAKKTGVTLPALSSSEEEDLKLPAPRKAKKKVIMSSDDFDPSAEPHEDDDDYVELDVGASDDESEYQASEAFSSPQRKAKGKGKATSRKATIDDRRTALLHSYDVGEAVPTVLLISLKAGALGLQLTVANNVYLMVRYFCSQLNMNPCSHLGSGSLVAGTCNLFSNLASGVNSHRVGGHRKPSY